ncbi:CHAT domain-containing tetratricopeptide repeat protein, partial [Catenibacterium mitsuokai]|uniref:CHAT domain-containing protein n=2 Tax=Catenibacterium mitsuokai TaxID=100886 RepID=UPI00319E579B
SYSDLGDYNKACELDDIVYNARKEILGEKHPDTLTSLSNLAISYFYLGNYNKACELQNIVYNIGKEILGKNHPDTLSTLHNLASYYSCLGDYNKACELQNIVYNIRKEILGEKHPDTLLVLSNLLVSQIHQDKTDNQSIKKNMTAYFENINNLKTTAFNIKEVSSRRNFLKSYNKVYKLLKSCVFERNIKDLVDYLFINKNLSFEMDVYRFHNEAMGERLSLEEVSHMISNKLVIDFYELDNSKYGLILIKKGKYSQCVVDYEDLISGSFINDEDIKSFIGSLEDYDHIYICPDGNLYNLSFERVLDCLNISYLSSVQTLFKKNTDDDYTDQLVSFVYPDFSGTQSEDNDRGNTKGVLYGSYLEGMFIHDIYGERSTIYSSYQANHDNFFNTKRPRVLHVSTHGDYLDNEHMEPMDRGILCLSGYNVEEGNSGYISAREIQYMNLKGTELVVLSACNTGLGENISGEGIYGIRRAFELAGCQTLLLTVEEVDDFNSAIFMKSFYERYNQTNNVYQSFKDTKEYLKKYGLVELKELRDVFEKEMKNQIKNPFVYTRNLNELNKRIEESETIGQIVRKKNNQYIQEDWNGFIIQGKIEN